MTSAEDKQQMREARETRLALKDIRVNTEHARKKLKEEALRKGKAIDGMANVIKFLIVPIEEALEQKENYAKVQEEKARQERKEWREQALQLLGVDTTLYDLAAMPEESYAKLLEASRTAFEEKKLAAEKAEQERIEREKAEAAERERIRSENERLKEEAEERQQEIDRERIAKEKAEAELLAKKREEERIERERQEADKKAALAPDREKLMQFAAAIASVPAPEVANHEAKAILNKAVTMLSEASQYVKTQALRL